MLFDVRDYENIFRKFLKFCFDSGSFSIFAFIKVERQL